jgi:hypothetical protein
MGNIKGVCEDSQLPFIEKPSVTTAKEMWDELKKLHQTNLSKINVHYLFEDLYTRKCVEGSSMDEHIAAMLDLSHRITSAGEKLDDLHLARAMVLSLPKTPSWELVKIPLFELTTLTSELVSTKILQEANRRTREKSGTESALVVRGRLTGIEAESGIMGRRLGICNKPGHWARGCPDNDADKEKKKGKGTVGDLCEVDERGVGRVYTVTGASTKPT